VAGGSETYRENKVLAEKRYLEIARDLGWNDIVPEFTEQSQTGTHHEGSAPRESDDEGGSGGMGISVSTMAPPLLDEQDMKSLYGLALANDVSGLSLYLGAHPNVNINELDEHGYTALHLACDRGNAAMVDFLLQRGADSGARDPDDFTALQLANVAGHGDIVNLLDRSSTSPM